MKKVVNQPLTKKLKNKLIDIEIKLKRSYQTEQQIEEQQAVDSIKNNPKFFFSYAKRHSKTKSKVGPLRNKNNKLIYDKQSIANILQDQYTSVFSTPKETDISYPNACQNQINDIIFEEKDIIEAISTLTPNAAPGPDGFPAVLPLFC